MLRESWTQSLSASRPHASRSGPVPCPALPCCCPCHIRLCLPADRRGTADCVFADYGPQATPIQIKGEDATASFLGCTFASAHAQRADGTAAAAIVAAQNSASIKLQQCTLEVTPGRLSAQLYVRPHASRTHRTHLPTLFRHSLLLTVHTRIQNASGCCHHGGGVQVQQGLIYSDETYVVDDISAGNPMSATLPLSSIPSETMFLTEVDEWVLTVRVRPLLARALHLVCFCTLP